MANYTPAYETKTLGVVGAKNMSQANLTQSVNTLSICIENNMMIDQLDFFFSSYK
ncbi:hypothetical protein ACFQDF_08790 [Ectobacillus funiculus]